MASRTFPKHIRQKHIRHHLGTPSVTLLARDVILNSLRARVFTSLQLYDPHFLLPRSPDHLQAVPGKDHQICYSLRDLQRSFALAPVLLCHNTHFWRNCGGTWLKINQWNDAEG
jgi:hypothetical protein